jgi:hypothetical protein
MTKYNQKKSGKGTQHIYFNKIIYAGMKKYYIQENKSIYRYIGVLPISVRGYLCFGLNQ